MKRTVVKELEQTAAGIRKNLLTLIHSGGHGHTGGSLSSTDILVALYYHVMKLNSEKPDWPDRDRFVLSKGHSAEGYYCILSDLGFFGAELLLQYGKPGSPLAGHPTVSIPGVELNTGALGHGLSAAIGMALAARMDKKRYRVFALMGDGELAEGSVWEAAMAGAHYRLSNLTAIIDRNGLQVSGRTEDLMALEDLTGKWRAFGWTVTDIDGHNMETLATQLGAENETSQPRLFIAHTVKGRGVSFMENQAVWHHKVPSAEQLQIALRELDNQLGKTTS